MVSDRKGQLLVPLFVLLLIVVVAASAWYMTQDNAGIPFIGGTANTSTANNTFTSTVGSVVTTINGGIDNTINTTSNNVTIFVNISI